jgi:phage tail protein X
MYTRLQGSRYLTTRYPEMRRLQGDYYIMSRSGDRLDLLAQRFYDDVRSWWKIAKANNLGKGTLSVPPGIQLRIPDPRVDYETALRNANQNGGV